MSPARPPYGTYNGENSVSISNDDESSSSVARKANLAQSMSTFLSERNVVLEEVLQTKKEAKMIQSESRRGQEEIIRRLSVFESRIQAFEALSRTMDRRTAGCENMMLQIQNEFELRLRNIDSEGAKHRREDEVNLRASIETVSDDHFTPTPAPGVSLTPSSLALTALPPTLPSPCQVRAELRAISSQAAETDARLRSITAQVPPARNLVPARVGPDTRFETARGRPAVRAADAAPAGA